MPAVTYKYTYKYCGPSSPDVLPSSPVEYSSRRQYRSRRHRRSTSSTKEDKSSRPLYLTVNNYHHGRPQCNDLEIPHSTQQENEAEVYRQPEGSAQRYTQRYYRHADRIGSARNSSRDMYDAYGLSNPYNHASHSTPPCISMQPSPPPSSAHECIIASPLPTTPIGCVIPGTNLVLNIPLAPPDASYMSSGRTKTGFATYGYIFPKQHATIHLIEPECFPFNGPSGFRYQVYKVPTSLTVGELMDQIMPTDSGSGQRFASARGIIECVDLGNRLWGRGQEFWIGGARGDIHSMRARVRTCTLENIGWTEHRSPIWLARTFV